MDLRSVLSSSDSVESATLRGSLSSIKAEFIAIMAVTSWMLPKHQPLDLRASMTASVDVSQISILAPDCDFACV